jgi:tetratricopeptide (TPR) repeat protein
MIDRDRALRPLRDAAPSIDRLELYESPAELTEALRATWHAVDTSLRLILRGEAAAPDELRLNALSRQDVSHDALITELRRRDRISLRLAGRVHELQQAVQRTESGDVRPRDADLALDVVRTLRREIDAPASIPEAGPAGPRAPFRSIAVAAGDAGDAGVASDQDVEDAAAADQTAAHAGGRATLAPLLRRPVALVAVAAVLLVAAVALVLLFGRDSAMEDGVAAFRAGEMGLAEQHFRAVVSRDDDNVTARLYLARILRTQGQQQEAAQVLQAAARTAPRDAAVRRELGHLFLDLDRAQQATQQFRTALELEPEEPLAWVGVYESLRRAGDSIAAAEVLRRAPLAAQQMIRTGRR